MAKYVADGQEVLYSPAPGWRLSLPETDTDTQKKKDPTPLILIPSPTLTQLTGFPNKPVLTFEQCRDLLLTSLGDIRRYRHFGEKEGAVAKDSIFILYDELNDTNKETSRELFLILFVYAVKQYLNGVSKSIKGIDLNKGADTLPTPTESDMKTHVVDFFKKIEKNVQHQFVLIKNFIKSTCAGFLYEISIDPTNDILRQNPSIVNEIYDRLDSQFHMTQSPLKAITFFSCISPSVTLDLSYDLYPRGYDNGDSPGRPFISGPLRLYIQAIAIMTAYY